jgi:hypothetical protein
MTDTATEPDIHPTSAETALTNAERLRRYRKRNAQRNGCDRNGRNDRNALTVTSPVTPSDGVMVLCPAQSKITIEFDEHGNALLRQSEWPDDDDVIMIQRDNIPDFIDRLTDALGIPSFGRP